MLAIPAVPGRFADVLEHLTDPWAAFDLAAEIAVPGGAILVSVPNVAFWATHVHLLRGRWPYNERGLYDDTHLRFFAYRNVVELCERGPARLERLHRTYRFVDRQTPLNHLAVVLSPLLRPLLTYQFIAVARIGAEAGTDLTAAEKVGATTSGENMSRARSRAAAPSRRRSPSSVRRDSASRSAADPRAVRASRRGRVPM